MIEVVVATAIFAVAIVAVIGLTAPLSKRVDDVLDSDSAARLGASIEGELRRLGYDWARENIPAPDEDPVYLVANSDGSRVRVELSSDADANLNAALPGIAERDRFFRVGIRLHTPYTDDSGSLAVVAEVVWPYHLPVGLRSTTIQAAFSAGGDPWTLSAAESRRSFVVFFGIVP